MPGYGIKAPDEGTGLLPWAWAQERLQRSHDYWVSTAGPDGEPNLMPVWGAWNDDSLWFSSAVGSRKSRNLRRDPRCSVATDDAQEPVVIRGEVEIVIDQQAVRRFLTDLNAKYETDIGEDFLDPVANATFRLRPTWAFALTEEDFEGSPTRWTF